MFLCLGEPLFFFTYILFITEVIEKASPLRNALDEHLRSQFTLHFKMFLHVSISLGVTTPSLLGAIRCSFFLLIFR